LKELKLDENVPVPEEKALFDLLFAKMKQGGTNFDKLKVRYYAPNQRGLVAA